MATAQLTEPKPAKEMATLARLVSELDVLIRARYPLIAVNTYEESRFLRAMQTIAELEWHTDKGLFTWSRVSGLQKWTDQKGRLLEEPEAVPDTQDTLTILDHISKQEKGLFVLCDYAPYISPCESQEDPYVVRKLREMAWQIKASKVSVFFVNPSFPNVPALEKEVKTIELDLPCEQEVAAMIDDQIERLTRKKEAGGRKEKGLVIEVTEQTREQLIQALLGLAETDIENVLAKAAIATRGISPASLDVILEEKKSVIRGTGALEYRHPEPTTNLGGYPNLRSILERHSITFTPQAREFGVEPAKGILLVGLPGCGKDLAMAIASAMMGRSLLKLDMGSVMGEGGGVIGSGAMTIKRALNIATTVQGILGISEFEKAVGGLASSNKTDGGETARTIGYLLNWMQEQSKVYVFATANDITNLAAEQTRRGRFSQIIFVDLPTPEERMEIFGVHLSKRGYDPKDFDLDELRDVADGFSGAEIEDAVKDGIVAAYMDGPRRAKTSDIVEQAKQIVPTSKMKKEQIDQIRAWAKEHMAINASGTDYAAQPTARRMTRPSPRDIEI